MTKTIFPGLLLALALIGCDQAGEASDQPSGEQTPKSESASDQASSEASSKGETSMDNAPHYLISIDGMTCQNCVKNVKGALEGFDGVDSADVDLAAGTASVSMKPGAQLDEASVTEAIDGRGFTTKSFAKQ